MNEKLKDFLAGIGAMAELWSVIFKNFKQQGYDDSTALMHTKAFMEVVIRTAANGGSEQ